MAYVCVVRVLVTGVRGLLGYHVAQVGRARGHAIYLTGRGPAYLSEVPYQAAGLTDPEAVQALIQWAQPEALLHCAAMTLVDACQEDPALCWLHNVTATRYLLEALQAQSLRAHFVFVSTDFVYDGFPVVRRPYVEGDYEAPLSVYGASKLAAEAWVRHYPGPWAIARTALVYGIAPTASRDNILTRVLTQLQRGHSLSLFTDQFRTPSWAQDVAEGLWLLVEKAAQGIYHLSGPDIETPYSFGQAIARVWGLPEALIEPATARDWRAPAPRPPYSPLSIEKARALGYAPHSTQEALSCISAAQPSL